MRIRALALVALTVAGGSAAMAADWTNFTSKENGFTAAFPGAPKEETHSTLTTVEGKDYMLETHQFSGKDLRGAFCIVAHSQYAWPITIDSQLTTNRDNMASGVGATVTSSKRTAVPHGAKEAPALLFDAAGPSVAFRVLEVIDGQHAYEVIAGVQIDSGSDADLDRCVKGFTLNAPK